MKNLLKCQVMMTIQRNFIRLLDYLIGIDLAKQTDTTIPQKINFTEKLE